MAKQFVKSLQNNEKIKTEIHHLINKADRNEFFGLLKKFGLATWSAVIAMAFLIIGIYLRKWLGH